MKENKITDYSELRAYVQRARSMTPEQILKYLGELRDFSYKYMTPQGRKFYESRLENKIKAIQLNLTKED